MSFVAPGNPEKRQPLRVRDFDGVFGPTDKVLRRTNDKGWELSARVANEVEDLNLGRMGVMRLRLGNRKIIDTGKTKTIEGILSVRVNGNVAYGIIYNETLELVTMPSTLKSRVFPVDTVPAATFSALTNETITVYPGELV